MNNSKVNPVKTDSLQQAQHLLSTGSHLVREDPQTGKRHSSASTDVDEYQSVGQKKGQSILPAVSNEGASWEEQGGAIWEELKWYFGQMEVQIQIKAFMEQEKEDTEVISKLWAD